MRRALIAALALMIAVGCSSKSSESAADKAIKNAMLTNESDSLAYIIGMSIGEQLIKMDSTMNAAMVGRAIVELFENSAAMSKEEAQTQYLRYLHFVIPERKRGYEEQFLSDLATKDRKYTRTKSGLTYTIEVIGNESFTAKGNNDWVSINYSISRIDGEQIAETTELQSGLSDLPDGVQESVKMVGKGGRIISYIPSKLAYGEVGDEELGIEPIETLRYTIEVVDVEKNAAQKRKKELKEANE